MHILIDTAFVLTQLHYRSDILVRHHDAGLNIRFLQPVNPLNLRQMRRIVNLHHGSVRHITMIDHAGRCGNQRQIVFPLQPFLNDIHMQQTQKSAAEAKAQRLGSFRLKLQGGIVELQLLQSLAQIIVFRRIRRIQPAVNHRIHFAITGQRFLSRIVGLRDRRPNTDVLNRFDAGGKPADFTAFQSAQFHFLRIAYTAFQHFIFSLIIHETNFVANLNPAFFNPDENNNAAVRIIDGIKDQRF